MKTLKYITAVLLTATTLMTPAYPANVSVDTDPNYQTVWLTGQILLKDYDAFKAKADALTGVYLVGLSGPGGRMVDALAIGAYIRKRGWTTAAYGECSSACAYIWLAGTTRYRVDNARIGFHAVSLNGEEKGSGNALVGAYMSSLGYGLGFIRWATSAGPADMSYLTPAVAKRLNVAMTEFTNPTVTKTVPDNDDTPDDAPPRLTTRYLLPYCQKLVNAGGASAKELRSAYEGARCVGMLEMLIGLLDAALSTETMTGLFCVDLKDHTSLKDQVGYITKYVAAHPEELDGDFRLTALYALHEARPAPCPQN